MHTNITNFITFVPETFETQQHITIQIGSNSNYLVPLYLNLSPNNIFSPDNNPGNPIDFDLLPILLNGWYYLYPPTTTQSTQTPQLIYLDQSNPNPEYNGYSTNPPTSCLLHSPHPTGPCHLICQTLAPRTTLSRQNPIEPPYTSSTDKDYLRLYGNATSFKPAPDPSLYNIRPGQESLNTPISTSPNPLTTHQQIHQISKQLSHNRRLPCLYSIYSCPPCSNQPQSCNSCDLTPSKAIAENYWYGLTNYFRYPQEPLICPSIFGLVVELSVQELGHWESILDQTNKSYTKPTDPTPNALQTPFLEIIPQTPSPTTDTNRIYYTPLSTGAEPLGSGELLINFGQAYFGYPQIPLGWQVTASDPQRGLITVAPILQSPNTEPLVLDPTGVVFGLGGFDWRICNWQIGNNQGGLVLI